MSDPPSPQNPDEPPHTQHVQKQHVSARVPEGVGRGVFSTGAILMTGGAEFVFDFIQNLGPPASVVARVVIPHGVMAQFIAALQKNLEMFTERFGPPPPLPRPEQPQRQQTVQEIYDELKLPDENLAGAYANGLMIGHSASEFKLDFLSNLFPHSAVSCRVFMSAPQVARLLETMKQNFQQFQARVQQPPKEPPAGQSPEPPQET